LVGLWRFNEASGNTALDSSSLHNEGILVGENGNVPARVPGQEGFGGALWITNNCDLNDPNNTGDRAYVQIPGNTGLKLGQAASDAWSFTCWAFEASDVWAAFGLTTGAFSPRKGAVVCNGNPGPTGMRSSTCGTATWPFGSFPSGILLR
jgi:hypothetical protein